MHRASISFARQTTTVVSRIICVGSLIWFGLLIAENLDSWDRVSAGPVKALSDSAAMATNRLVPFEPGYWSFAGTTLTIQQQACSEKQLESMLNDFANLDRPESSSGYDASALIALAESMSATKSKLSGDVLHALDNPTTRLRLHTTDPKQPMLIRAVFATRHSERDDWNLKVLRPDSKQTQDLIPMPNDVERLCLRRSESGAIQMEMITTEASADSIIQLWQSTGWSVDRTPWGDGHEFSYICHQNGHSVYAWSASKSGKRTMMLTDIAADQSVVESDESEPNIAGDWIIGWRSALDRRATQFLAAVNTFGENNK